MRDYSIIDMLQAAMDRIPLHLRGNLCLAYDLNEENLDKNLESIYQIAISRLTHIDYYFQWSYNILKNPQTLPPPADFLEVEGMLHQFNDLENMTEEETSVLNHSFSKWIRNLLLRELDEFLQYYLLAIYETCLIIKFIDKEITPSDFVDARAAAKNFEESSLKDRLKILRQEYKVDFKHKSELYSLHKLRHIFAHFDGVIQKKFCNKNGVLEVTWPVNSVKLKHRITGRFVPFNKVTRPFNKEYGEIHITWLNTPKKAKYNINDKIELSHAELNQLVFFYLYVFNELHDSLVEYAKIKGIKVRPFEKYSLTPNLWLIGEETA